MPDSMGHETVSERLERIRGEAANYTTPGAEFFDVIVSEGHGEYGFTSGNGITVTDLWAPNYDEDFDDYDAEWERVTGLPAGQMPDADLGYERIVRIQGTRAALTDGMKRLLDDLADDPGGDDGTFDYWPSGMRFAIEIDSILGGEFSYAIGAIAFGIIDGTGRREFADELYGKIGLERPPQIKHLRWNVWVVVTPPRPDVKPTDLEILDKPPAWDLREHGQVCFFGAVNGGDSVEWPRPPGSTPLLNRITS